MENLHWILIGSAICAILVFQIVFYVKMRKRVSILKSIFPFSPQESLSITNGESAQICTKIQVLKQLISAKKKEIGDKNQELQQVKIGYTEAHQWLEANSTAATDLQSSYQKEEEKYSEKIQIIKSELKQLVTELQELETQKATMESAQSIDNDVLKNIIDSINNYLANNKGGTTDFNLVKDIVDRNYDAVEEEIQTQIPFPLYFGLMGTMAGIIIGVGYLVLSGGLKNLLATSQNVGAEGIQALLGGVALAMICSILGIILTTIGSNIVKNGKANAESKKQNFLSWLQAELLPAMNKDSVSAMRLMTDNLNKFNNEFKKAIPQLGNELGQVKETTEAQVELLQQVNKLRPTQLASANVMVYEKLQNCSSEIGRIAEVLDNSASYLEKVQKLSDKLDEQQELLNMIRQMANFFKETKEGLSGAINMTLGKSQETLDKATKRFSESLGKQFNELGKEIVKHTDSLKLALNEEQKQLNSRVQEFTTLTKEIQQLSSVKSSMDKLKETTAEQNKKIDNLADSIREFARIKTTGGEVKTKLTFPKGLKILLCLGSIAVTLASLAGIALFIFTFLKF